MMVTGAGVIEVARFGVRVGEELFQNDAVPRGGGTGKQVRTYNAK